MKTITKTKKIKTDHDSAWKEILSSYLPQALAWCFPALHAQIDWEKEWVFLDKELSAITRDGKIGTRVVDKLIRVHLKNGTASWLLVHFEIEQHPDIQIFAERVFIYNVRLYDKFRHPVVSCIMLADSSPSFKPTTFTYGEWISQTRIDFYPCKLLDFNDKFEELEKSKDAFATVILCHLEALAAKKTKRTTTF